MKLLIHLVSESSAVPRCHRIMVFGRYAFVYSGRSISCYAACPLNGCPTNQRSDSRPAGTNVFLDTRAFLGTYPTDERITSGRSSSGRNPARGLFYWRSLTVACPRTASGTLSVVPREFFLLRRRPVGYSSAYDCHGSFRQRVRGSAFGIDG